jgi:hypothetical protein
MLDTKGLHRLAPLVKKSFWTISTAGGALFVVYALYIGRREFSLHEWSIEYQYLVPSFAAYSVALIMVAATWSWILKSLGVTLPFKRNIKLHLFTAVTRQLPTIIWSVGSLLFLYERDGVPKRVTSAAILLERALLTLSNVALCLLILPAIPAAHIPQARVIPLLLLPLLVVFLRPAVLIGLLNLLLTRLGRPPVVLSLPRRQATLWCALYAAAWGLGGVFLYLSVVAIYPSAITYPLEICGAWLLSGLVSTLRVVFPVGMWREISLAYLLAFIMPLPAALVIALLSKVWIAAIEACWFLISLML